MREVEGWHFIVLEMSKVVSERALSTGRQTRKYDNNADKHEKVFLACNNIYNKNIYIKV